MKRFPMILFLILFAAIPLCAQEVPANVIVPTVKEVASHFQNSRDIEHLIE